MYAEHPDTGRLGDRPPEPWRIVQWAQQHGEVGGVMTSHRQMTAALRSSGHDVTYVDTGSALRALRALPSVWGRRSLHVLHITRLFRAAQLAPAFALFPVAKALVLHSGYSAKQLEGMPARRRRVVMGALRTFDEVWVVNGGIRDLLPPDLADRTTVVTPFDARGMTPQHHDGRDMHALALATNAGLPHYNADLGVEATELVRQEWPDARLHLLAYGHDGADLARLRSRVSGLDWVQLSFDLPPQQVSAVLARTGVFLRPTSWDGDSVMVREALALGARVVASDCAPRPPGVELCRLDPEQLASAVLHGGTGSDGAGLADTTLAEAAERLLAEASGGDPRR
jgi:hypothetical protein